MAIRNIRIDGDEILRKKSREVEKIDKRIIDLLDDMYDTMQQAEGVGLAAVQVGILKRVVVIDVGQGPIELINPEIIDEEGKEINIEGCLSIPEVYGEVERPKTVTVKAKNRDGVEYILTGEGLLARALCHEIDHLNGVLFKDKVIKFVDMESEED